MAELSDDSAGGASTTAAPGTDSPEAVGALAAAMQVTVDIPSTLTEVEGNDEYRLRWNQLSAHASFSRVVPDIGSMHLPNPWLFTDQLTYKATDFNSDYKYQDDLTNIWRNTTINGYVYNNAAMVLPVNKYAYLGSPDSLRPSDSPKPENTKNRMSPKCRYQRSSGAREREVMVYLEHFYVALAGEDEVHQLNKCVPRPAGARGEAFPLPADPALRAPPAQEMEPGPVQLYDRQHEGAARRQQPGSVVRWQRLPQHGARARRNGTPDLRSGAAVCARNAL